MTGAPTGDSGTTTVEVVILAPLIVALLCFVVGLGRVTDARSDLTGATRDAARAASLAPTPDAARTAAHTTAAADLQGAGIDCLHIQVSVNTADLAASGHVSVTIGCTTDLSALVISGLPGHTTLHATSIAPIDTYTQAGT